MPAAEAKQRMLPRSRVNVTAVDLLDNELMLQISADDMALMTGVTRAAGCGTAKTTTCASAISL